MLYVLIFEDVETKLKFNQGKDQDWPYSSEQVIVFNPNDQYKLEGSTHNDISHALKHLSDFKPATAKSLLNKLRSFLEANARKIIVKNKSGETVKNFNTDQILNEETILYATLDRVNDKVVTGGELNYLEEYCQKINTGFKNVYNSLINIVLRNKQNIDSFTEDQLRNNLPTTIEFKIDQVGLFKIYVYDYKTEGLLILRDNGKINTFFKLKKSELKNYVKSSGKPANFDLLNHL
jgi:hypothetical protein